MATSTESKKKTKQGAKSPPAIESPSDRFTRLATARVGAAIKRLRLIRNLSGSGYKSSPEQREKLLDALEDEVQALRRAFSDKVEKDAPTFTF